MVFATTELYSWAIVPFTVVYCGYLLAVCFYALHFPGFERFDAWFERFIPGWLKGRAQSTSEGPSPSYSLWLSPALDDPATATLSALIVSLPGPVFPPHATLLGEAPEGTTLPEVLKAIERAVDKTYEDGKTARGKGMVVEFEDVRTGKEYFRCVLVKLKESLSAATPSILSLHRQLLLALPSKTERKPFYPHISLLYSHIPVSPDRKEIVQRLYADGSVRAADGGGVELFAPDSKGKGEGVKQVRCDRVSVVRTKGLEVGEWVVVGEVKI